MFFRMLKKSPRIILAIYQHGFNLIIINPLSSANHCTTAILSVAKIGIPGVDPWSIKTAGNQLNKLTAGNQLNNLTAGNKLKAGVSLIS